MPTINWNELDSPNQILLAWSLVSQEISDKFFNGTLIAVPSIDQASYFDLMVCFEKVTHFWQRTPTFRLLGHFLDISAPLENEKEMMKVLRNPLREDLNSTSFTYTWTDDKNNKSVTIKMTGMSKYELNWNLKPGSLVLDCKKVDLCNDSVYIISEVVYASVVIIDVQIKKNSEFERKVIQINNGTIPVAFSYLKFPVDKNGVLLAAKETKLKFNAVFERQP